MRHSLLCLLVTVAPWFCIEKPEAATLDGVDPQSTQLLLQAAELGADLTPPGAQIDLYRTIAEELAVMGAVSEATKLANFFDDGRRRDLVLLQAVRGSLRANRLDQAVETGNLITEEYEQGQAFVGIARFQAERGDFVQAMTAIATIKFGPLADQALSAIVQPMVKAGQITEAIEAALKLDDSSSKGQVISSIVTTQYRLGDKKAARETAATLSQRINDDWPLLTLSQEEAEVGNFQEAHEIASHLDRQLHFFALGDIAAAHARVGHITKALNVAMSIPFPVDRYEFDSPTRYRAIRDIARTQAEKGDYDGALSTAQRIPPKISACDICGSLRNNAMQDIGVTQAQRGDFILARRTAQKLKKSRSSYGDEILKTVVSVQAKRGKIEAALETAQKFSSQGYRASMYQDIAEYWVKRDGKRPVMKWASQLPNKIEKAYALVGIARSLELIPASSPSSLPN
jgi:tetratricopeptide (TPR) repeat protein